MLSALATFQREILGIFSDLLNHCIEIFMNEFAPYGDAFETIVNLEKVLERFVQTNVALSTVKCDMMMNEGIVLGHLISTDGIKVDPAKIEVIVGALI